MKRILILLLALSLSMFALACSAARPAEVLSTAEPAAPTQEMVVQSSEIAAPAETPAITEFAVASEGISNGILGDAYGAHGEQKSRGIPTLSFPLTFSNAPAGTACYALSVIDPDGGNWVHWLAVNLPLQDLAENASVDLAESLIQGKNDFGQIGYGGPTPPSGTHTYVITVYALSAPVSLENGFSQKQFNAALENNVLASAELTGDYAK